MSQSSKEEEIRSIIESSQTHYIRYKWTLDFVSSVLNASRPLRILDFGTGGGAIALLLKKSFPQHEIVAGDILINKETEEKLASEGVECINGLIIEPQKNIPLESNSFDVIMFLEVLEHVIADPQHIFNEIYRILRPEGYLILTTPNIAQLLNRLMLLVGKQPQIYLTSLNPDSKGTRGHFREWTANELIDLLKTSFKIEKSVYIDTVGTKGLLKRKRMLAILYYPYKLIGLIKPSFRNTIAIMCQKHN